MRKKKYSVADVKTMVRTTIGKMGWSKGIFADHAEVPASRVSECLSDSNDDYIHPKILKTLGLKKSPAQYEDE